MGTNAILYSTLLATPVAMAAATLACMQDNVSECTYQQGAQGKNTKVLVVSGMQASHAGGRMRHCTDKCVSG